MVTQATTSEDTRKRIMQTAFNEFYRCGFQGASLNRIVAEASTTKGALFHHFRGKADLGLAVVDEILFPEVRSVWVDPLNQSDDPIRTITDIMTRMAEECSGDRLCQGCPLNNLAQEMSPLDEEFRLRLEQIYAAWRGAIEASFTRGISAGNIDSAVNPKEIAAFMVACFAGTIGTAKNAQDPNIMALSGAALMKYMETLRP